MEPLSTMILWAAAMVAMPVTATPKWKQGTDVRIISDAGTVVRDYAHPVQEQAKEICSIADDVSLSEPVFAELLSYKDFRAGWDGEDSVAPSASDVDSAIEFVQMLRLILPLPGAMLDPNGEVGLYWNTDRSYADITFDRDGTISIYLRDRMTGMESFLDALNPRDPGSLLPLMDLLTPMPLAA